LQNQAYVFLSWLRKSQTVSDQEILLFSKILKGIGWRLKIFDKI